MLLKEKVKKTIVGNMVGACMKCRRANNIIAMLLLITLVALLISIIYPPFIGILTDFGGLVEGNTTYYSFIKSGG